MKKRKWSLTSQILMAMGLGVVLGAIAHGVGVDTPVGELINRYLIEGVVHVGGAVFIATLKMMIVPLVFVSLVCGVTATDDTHRLGALGAKTFTLYLLTTCLAIMLALGVGAVFDPGAGADLGSAVEFKGREAPAVSDVIISIFPANPVQAMAEGNMLQVIVFSLLLGLAISKCGEPGNRVIRIFNDFNVVIMKLVHLVMLAAPVGVFCLVTKVFAGQGLGFAKDLAGYFSLVVLTLALHTAFTFSMILRFLGGLNPLTFFTKMRSVMLFAFSTASSAATMPFTLQVVEERLGVKNSVASFSVPLGATINMDGTAIMQGVATVFIAGAYNVELGLAGFLTVILTATLASIGTAAVPGAGMITLAMVLGQVGLPVEAIGLILGVDRLLDMLRTAVNVAGDAMVSCIVAKSEGGLDRDVFRHFPDD